MEKLASLWCALILVLALVALPSVQGVEKVKVELYSESLCPGCSEFIVNFLNPFFNNGLIDIVELRIIPYGNARVLDGKLVCQHGPDECELNIIQTCAIRLWPKVTDWFPFIYCLESLERSTAAKNWKSCVHPSHLDLDPLLECSASPLGAKLEMEFAAETDRLQPPHKYVPWVLVNGEPLSDNYEDVAVYVCKAYQGNKPAVCSRLEHEILKTKPARVCVKENVLLGELNAGFVSTNNTRFVTVLKKAELLVFLKGLVHFQLNVGFGPAMAITAFPLQNAALHPVARALFTPNVTNEVLQMVLQKVDQKMVDSIHKPSFPRKVHTLVAHACAKCCGKMIV